MHDHLIYSHRQITFAVLICILMIVGERSVPAAQTQDAFWHKIIAPPTDTLVFQHMHSLCIGKQKTEHTYYKIAKQRALWNSAFHIRLWLRACCCFLVKLFHWLPNKFAQHTHRALFCMQAANSSGVSETRGGSINCAPLCRVFSSRHEH
jgi:hypothetical protein